MLLDQEMTKSRVFEVLGEAAAQSDHAPRPLGDLAYTSQDLFERELDTIFRNQWVCVGRVDEFRKPGDYIALKHGKVPILVVKQTSGAIVAMVNACSHRMVPLAEGRGNQPRFVCPYHAWSYNRDGALIAAPGMPADMDKRACDLQHFQVETWLGFVYVNPDATAPSLKAGLGPLDDLFRPYPIERMKTMRHENQVWNCNWKLAVDNFMESYHFPAVHAASLGGFYPSETLKMSIQGDNYAFYDITMPPEAVARPEGSKLLENPDITIEQKQIMYTGGIFPNSLFTVQHDQIVWMRAQPLAVDKTLIDFGIAGDFDLAEDGSWEKGYYEYYLANLADQINDEDRAVVESIQANAGSGLARRHLLHPSEHGMLTFARFLDQHVRTPNC